MELAQAHDLPVMWFKLEDEYAVVVDNGKQVFRQTTVADSFITYFTSFSVFGIDWNQMMKVFYNQVVFLFWVTQTSMFLPLQNGKKTKQAVPNRKSLEFVHAVILTKRLDYTKVKLPPGVMKLITRYVMLERRFSDQ